MSKDLVYAPSWVDTTYLHLHTYFHNPQKKTGLNCGSMTCPTGGAPNINYGKNNYGKNNYGKTGQSALAPDFTGKINYGNNGHLQELWKKRRFGSLPGYFEPLWGKIQLWKNRTQAPPV